MPMPIQKRHPLAEVGGWYGAAALIVAYCLVSFGGLSANSVWYQLLNLTGALGIMMITTTKHVRQSVIVNVFWAAVAGFSLLKIVFV